jgi:cobalt-zinc-cadmium efflux system membrane fusion protein
MDSKISKKQLAYIVGIVAVGVVLALLIMLTKPRAPAGDAGEAEHAEEQVASKAEGKAGKDAHEAEEAHSDSVKLTDAQISASGIKVLKAGPATIRSTLTLPGEIKFNQDRTAQVVPLLEGTVQAVHADIGQSVKKGQVLAVIASVELSDLRSQLLTAEKRLSLAKTTLAREKKLWEEKISAEQDYLQARQAMQEAEIDYRNAEQKLRALGSSAHSKGGLNSYELRAPFNGVVVEKAVSLGQSVKEDSSLFTIADLSTVWADVAVPVRASALETEAVGKIAYVGSLLGAETRTATARVVLPNPALSWRPGLFVNVDVQLQSNQREAPVTVAAAALQTVEEKPTVFVRMPGGFRAEHVTLGRRDAATVEVTKGLAPGTEYAAGNSFVIKAELGKSSDEDSH